MEFTQEQIKKIAKLARIKLEAKEMEELPKELSSILKMVEQLEEVDVSNIEALTSVSAMDLFWRKDEVTSGNIASDIIMNAPDSELNFFKVPKVVENE